MSEHGGVWRVKDESVSMERLDGETILINFDTGQYFSLQGSAADILWLVQSGVERAEWGAVLQQAFTDLGEWDASADAEVDDFLACLIEAGILAQTAPGEHGHGQPLPDDYKRGAWTAPSVFANDELADLLVIDPIHEASEDGWPQARTP